MVASGSLVYHGAPVSWRSRRRSVAAVAATLLLVGSYATYQVSNSRTFQFFGEIVSRVETQEKFVALTFDDGPTPGYTEEVLAALEEEDGAKATFFVVGEELEQNPDQGEKIVEAGHELGNHSYSHERMVLVSPSFVEDEVERTDELIRRAGHREEILFRPPYAKKLLALPYYLWETGRTTVTWDVEPDSYPEVAEDSSEIVERVREQARPGSIILLHPMGEGDGQTREAIGGITAGLKEDGYGFVTVSELLREAYG